MSESNSFYNNVTNPDYSFMNTKNFFGGTDPIRIVIIIYIFLCIILNTLNLTVFFVTMKRAKREIPIAIWIMISVLIVNFIHTFTYLFEWVIKEDIDTVSIDFDGRKVEVGGLLTGNPNNMFACYTQGFLLIFSSIVQDFLINIFFYLVSSNKEKEISSKLIIGLSLGLGVGFPFIFTLILALTHALGINDEFCYVNKFDFDISDGEVIYKQYKPFQIVVAVVYLIRVVNLVATIYFLIQIISYIRSRNESKLYLFKSIFIPIIQSFTIIIGVIYRLINMASPEISVEMSSVYLILNTSDGVLFPVGFFLQFNIFQYLNKLIYGEKVEEKENSIEFTQKCEEEETDE